MVRGTYHAATSRRPHQDEAPDKPADDEVQREQRGAAAQGAAARHDPDAHPMDAEEAGRRVSRAREDPALHS